jgi:predicted  nucleic acid-binding Zn-ribbon protein
MPDQLSNIERSIGELRGDVRAILRQMELEREDAKDSRARVYERVERVENSVAITGQIAAQARDKANAVETTLTNDVKPQTDRLKLLGVKGGAFIAGASLLGGFVAQPFFTTVAAAFEKIFKT